MKSAVKRLSWTLALGCASALSADRPPDIAQAASAARAPISTTAANTVINERDKQHAQGSDTVLKVKPIVQKMGIKRVA